ncbi:hypothetical protein N1851_015789 [Merluccius polli]|uniref:Uncharacterized protein n=1 Tax=Merluccius polli TaxID=89951 RepID=A0AA47MSE1_MERPO|nr:hypothetical protein N1851_015789 [Merluccius polli]
MINSIRAKAKQHRGFKLFLEELSAEYVDLHHTDVRWLTGEFEDRFNHFDKLEPCVAFIANPFMEVDKGEISEQMAELLSVYSVEMEVKHPKSCPAKIPTTFTTFLEPGRPRKL